MSGHDPLALAEWQRIRRYAVPDWMIAECTAARERGDWRAACAAAQVDVAFGSVPGEIADMLAGFAPDLVRWHIPRALGGYTTIAVGRQYVLVPHEGTIDRDTVVLTLTAPVSLLGSQRLTLGTVRFGDLEPGHPLFLPAYLWDARHAGQLRTAIGGTTERLPRRSPGQDISVVLGVADDPPARVERARAAPTLADAFLEAGFHVPDARADRWSSPGDEWIRPTVDPHRIAHDVRLLDARFGPRLWALWADHRRYLGFKVNGDRIETGWYGVPANRAYWNSPERHQFRLHADLARYPIDLDLIAHGRLTAADLHPLVREALFPDFSGMPSSRTLAPPPIRVRCRGEWHEIGVHQGRLALTAHSVDEQQRERAMRAFGGVVTGCFAAEQTWHGAEGRLPRRLRAHREDLWQRMIHGGTRTVLELLDAGMDPHLRDSRGQTLMHRLRSYDYVLLLPRLLAEGLDVNARDLEGNTPLYLAVVYQAPGDLIRSLVDAGADPDATNQDDMSVIDYLDEILGYRDDLDPTFEEAVDYLRKQHERH